MTKDCDWPKKGNKAFMPAADGKSFHLRALTWRAQRHAAAFHRAAGIVVDECQDDEGYPRNDEFFLPIAYLYRHCLELRMKDIIVTGLGLQFFTPDDVDNVLNQHNLARLWSPTKRLLVHRWPNADQAPLKAVEAIVNEFHQADPNGQVFRYDTDKHGQRHSYASLPDHISLTELRQTMEGAFNFLDATATELEQNLSDLLDNDRQ